MQYDNLSGIIPDRLSYYFFPERKKFLTFHQVEAVCFWKRLKKTAALYRYERMRGDADHYIFEFAGR